MPAPECWLQWVRSRKCISKIFLSVADASGSGATRVVCWQKQKSWTWAPALGCEEPRFWREMGSVWVPLLDLLRDTGANHLSLSFFILKVRIIRADSWPRWQFVGKQQTQAPPAPGCAVGMRSAVSRQQMSPLHEGYCRPGLLCFQKELTDMKLDLLRISTLSPGILAVRLIRKGC